MCERKDYKTYLSVKNTPKQRMLKICGNQKGNLYLISIENVDILLVIS